jgi:outer membrane receptor protein involved in Fe transport
MSRHNSPQRSRLATALFAALLVPATAAYAQEDTASQQDDQQTTTTATTPDPNAKTLQKVIVTGSLIPQTELETFRPLTIITAEDIQTRGFTSVADVLQQTSFATGSVQGNQTSASFTQGAETLSLFGLSPSYVKYLIDGRPMANYPALYNGSDIFNNISGIPIDLVERIEILPGGQSSLYGSDAIAGVVNVILKKHIDGTIVSARIGGYHEGGGASGRISVADQLNFADDRLSVLVGGQYEKTDPIWGYQRDLTDHYNTEGTSAPLAGRDWLVYSPFSSYYFPPGADCNAVSTGFGGTEQLQTRPGFGDGLYCGSFATPGYRTLKNGKESTQAYTHATFDVSPNMQLYADALYSIENVKYHIGSNYTWWGTGVEWGYFFDPRAGNAISDIYCGGDPSCPPGDLLNLQRAFAPEDMGDWERTMGNDKNKSYRVSFGANGTFGESYWDYDLGFTRTEYKLEEHSLARLADPINAFFQEHVLGPQLGWDPYFGNYPIFEPDYAAFYTLLTPEQFSSFMGETVSNSRTYDNMVRGVLTNSALFQMPGGDAGFAIAVEGGNQGWRYDPDPRLLNGEIWGTTAVSGGGDRSRYAVTSEVRLPLMDMLTATVSGRYDSYHVADEDVSKPTYSVGLEFRPFQSLLFRGKLGTAFKAPTLSDQFQGESGFYSYTTDYYNCNELGFDPDHVDDCPAQYSSVQYFGTQKGNPALDPINADVWSYGVVWAPTPKLSFGADYHHFDIRDEVAQQSVDQLMRDELDCRTGVLDPSSGSCQAAFAQIHRGSTGRITQIDVSKVNIAQEIVNAVTGEAHYLQDLGSMGGLQFNASYTRMLKHEYQLFPTDPVYDLLDDPYNSSDPVWKANASLGWHIGSVTTTLYANILGPTPNYFARNNSDGYAHAGAEKLDVYTIYNGSINWALSDDFKVSFLVNNLFNKMPTQDRPNYPGSSGAPFNASQFSPYGRAYYIEARWNFGKAE